MTITTVGIDLAKNVFAVHCVDQNGKTVLVKPRVSYAHDFKNGRQLAAWLGLTPSQYSSGRKSKLGGITKAGDSYLRTLLVQWPLPPKMRGLDPVRYI